MPIALTVNRTCYRKPLRHNGFSTVYGYCGGDRSCRHRYDGRGRGYRLDRRRRWRPSHPL